MGARPKPTPVLRLAPPFAPFWVGEALGAEVQLGGEVEKEGVLYEMRRSRDWDGRELLFLRLEVPEAARLEDETFRFSVARCYVGLAETLQSRDLRPLRIWNYVPEIRRPSDEGFSRYEVFNEGRKQGYVEWYGESDRSGRVPSAGVGHRGEAFVLHALACSRPATPVENPRQRPAYRYSTRYGPAAPCFSRGSRLAGGLPSMRWPALGVVAGTASIVGEDSRHFGDVEAQLRETCLNLAVVGAKLAGGALPERLEDDAAAAALALYRELRVYVVHEGDASDVASELRERLPGLARLDFVAADLCRPELLVEAEGIVRCDAE
jgi:chorismate lyase/3-hydroxybenzoate synthase